MCIDTKTFYAIQLDLIILMINAKKLNREFGKHQNSDLKPPDLPKSSWSPATDSCQDKLRRNIPSDGLHAQTSRDKTPG